MLHPMCKLEPKSILSMARMSHPMKEVNRYLVALLPHPPSQISPSDYKVVFKKLVQLK